MRRKERGNAVPVGGGGRKIRIKERDRRGRRKVGQKRGVQQQQRQK